MPPGSHGRLWLVCLNSFRAQQGTKTHDSGISRECTRVQLPSPQGRGACKRPFHILPVSPEVTVAHNIRPGEGGCTRAVYSALFAAHTSSSMEMIVDQVLLPRKSSPF